jgi:multicomponent Na+:H+ antiporter subunit B
MTGLVTDILLVMLAIVGIAVIRTRNLFAAVMLSGIYSLVSAGLFVVMDAVDVAFTEAAVGAGISTVLMLGTLALVGYKEEAPSHRPILPLFVVLVTGGILVYGTSEMPPFGAADNPAHLHVAPYYLEESEQEIHIPNVVTSVLASYRGYDTMGETAVIFTAMVGVLLLLARGPLPRRVFHGGRWMTVRPGTTREELEALIAEEDADRRPPVATETGTLSSHRGDEVVYREPGAPPPPATAADDAAAEATDEGEERRG